MLNRCYTFRLYPSLQAETELRRILRVCAEVWNIALEERRYRYYQRGEHFDGMRQSKESLTPLIDACRTQTEIYGVPWMGGFTGFHEVPATAHRRVLTRMDDAYKAFFKRKSDGAGLPRFKSSRTYDSFTVQIDNGASLIDENLVLYWDKRNVTVSIPIVLHRPILGSPKFVTVRRNGHVWEATVQASDVPEVPLPKTGASIGLDAGLKNFATLSDGTEIANPRFLKRAQKNLARAQNKASRSVRVVQRLFKTAEGKRLDTRSAWKKIAQGALTNPSDYGKMSVPSEKKGSNRLERKKAIVAKQNWRVGNSRKEHHCQTSARLVRKFDVIAIEKLNLVGLTRGILSKSFADAGIGMFFLRLQSAAEMACKSVIKVPAAGTTIDCSACGAAVPKTLADRIHVCTCGLTIDRDLNAARNILARSSEVKSEPPKIKRPRYMRKPKVNAGKPAQPGDNGLLDVEADPQPKDTRKGGEASSQTDQRSCDTGGTDIARAPAPTKTLRSLRDLPPRVHAKPASLESDWSNARNLESI